MKAIAQRFSDRLDDLESCIHLLDDLRRLGASTAPLSAKRTRLGQVALTVRDRLAYNRSWQTVSLDGCVLWLAAEYEMTTRDLAERLATAIASRARTYRDLPPELREANERLVGTLLSDVGRPRLAHIPHTRVVQNLAVCFAKGRPVELFCLGFGFHDHNLRSDEVSSMFKRLGVKDLWRRLAENPTLASLLGTTGTHLTERQARASLDEFVEVRNQVMHRGPTYSTVGGTVLLQYVAFFRCFVPALADLLSLHAASYR